MFLTAQARQVLAESVPLETAVRTASRAAALVAGFITGDAELFGGARGDEIHEGPRSRARPQTAAMVERARAAGALHAAWSGSGPSIVAIVDSAGEAKVAEALRSDDVRVMRLDVATEGVEFSA